MCYFNIAHCFAKCGYIEKAILALKAVTLEDFQVVVDYNRGIFELLSRNPDLD